MLLRAADENFNGNMVRGLCRRQPALDLVRLQDVGLSGADGPAVLAWAAQERRVLLTHDVSTITQYAYERVREGQPMPGVFEVSRDLPIGRAIDAEKKKIFHEYWEVREDFNVGHVFSFSSTT